MPSSRARSAVTGLAKQNEFKGDLRADEKWKNRRGQRGKNANGNFRLGETRSRSGNNKVAKCRQFRAAADGGAVHHTKNRFGSFQNPRKHGMESVKHLEDTLGGVLAYIDSAAENFASGI